MSNSETARKIAGYKEFLRSKMIAAPERGLEIDASAINPLLKPHQAAIVRWAPKGRWRHRVCLICWQSRRVKKWGLSHDWMVD